MRKSEALDHHFLMQTVTEIVGRSDQGVIHPFICRCGDGHEYFVKGATAGRRALVCEWIASNLARQLNLPVPPVALTEVDRALIEYGSREDLADLGAGVWFGSRAVAHVIELPYSAIAQIEPELRATALLFDWWVLNKDRNFGPDGGNPNLLWEANRARMHMIDHNLTFEPGCAAHFWEGHVFGVDRALWTDAFRSNLEPQMKRAIELVDELWSQMPDEWYEDLTDFGVDEVKSILLRYEQDGFWRFA